MIEAYNSGKLAEAVLTRILPRRLSMSLHATSNIVAGKRIMKLIALDLGINRTPFQNITDEEEIPSGKNLKESTFSKSVTGFKEQETVSK